jgi:hypothetical protein
MRGACAGEQAVDLACGQRRELVDHHDRGDRRALHPCDERDEVDDDRPGEHRAQQQPAACIKAEVDDRGGRDRPVRVQGGVSSLG